VQRIHAAASPAGCLSLHCPSTPARLLMTGNRMPKRQPDVGQTGKWLKNAECRVTSKVLRGVNRAFIYCTFFHFRYSPAFSRLFSRVRLRQCTNLYCGTNTFKKPKWYRPPKGLTNKSRSHVRTVALSSFRVRSESGGKIATY
jgi:hypothetical protein